MLRAARRYPQLRKQQPVEREYDVESRQRDLSGSDTSWRQRCRFDKRRPEAVTSGARAANLNLHLNYTLSVHRCRLTQGGDDTGLVESQGWR